MSIKMAFCITGLLVLLLVESISMAPYMQEHDDAPSDSEYQPIVIDWDGVGARAPLGASENKVDVKAARVAAAGCPPGLWCGKKRELALETRANAKEVGQEQVQQGDDLKPVEMEILSKQKRCPPGLWCGK